MTYACAKVVPCIFFVLTEAYYTRLVSVVVEFCGLANGLLTMTFSAFLVVIDMH